MTQQELANNTLYISDNGHFSSLDKDAVDKWEKMGLRKDELTRAEQRLWECKGEIKDTVYNMSFLKGREEKQEQIKAQYYRDAVRKLKRYHPNAVLIGSNE